MSIFNALGVYYRNVKSRNISISKATDEV